MYLFKQNSLGLSKNSNCLIYLLIKSNLNLFIFDLNLKLIKFKFEKNLKELTTHFLGL